MSLRVRTLNRTNKNFLLPSDLFRALGVSSLSTLRLSDEDMLRPRERSWLSMDLNMIYSP
jgi:hypothetical protein